MPFSCACRQHQIFSGGNVSFIHKISNKKIKVDVLNFMKHADLLPRNASAICQLCINHVNDNLLIHTTNKRKNSSKKEQIINDILSNIDIDELVEVASAVGERICGAIEADSVECSCIYRETGNLENFKITEWLGERNKVLVSLLRSACGMNTTPSRKKEICLVTAVDSIYKARRLSHVSPIQFAKNLVSYHLSGSKVLSKLNNRQTACGSYSTLKRWLKTNSSKPIDTTTKSDNITFFDNNQVIARNWRVTFAHKSTASVITMLIHISPKIPTNIQQNGEFNPRKWLFANDNKTTITAIRENIKEAETSFKNIRNSFIQTRLQHIMAEGATDTIQERLDGFIGPRNRTDTIDPYAWVPSCHSNQKPNVHVGEPALCNPCSYDSVRKVLEHIKKQCGVGDNKQWACAGCDGLPYVLAHRLMEKEDSLRDILLVPGLGHIEMTAVKACFRLLWDVCLVELAKMLGFKSPRALMCCKACTDHHKSWMILNIFFHSTMDEILHFYLSNDRTPSVAGLYNFIAKSDNKNFRFLCDVVFNNVLAVFVFRCGVRRNNSDYIWAGKSQFLKLFYGLNHTFYQEIMYRDFRTHVLAPEQVNTFLTVNEAFSVSGHPSKGEGGDFVLESYNRRAKRWLPPGIPQQQHWLDVCRNLNVMEKIRDNTLEEMCMSEELNSVYQRDFSTEMFEWRVKLRATRYLSNTEADYREHTSLSGERLDTQLIGFETTCQRNLSSYLDSIAKGMVPGKGLSLTPVFVTPNDRTKFHALEKKTKQQIATIIEAGITEIHNNGDADEAFVLEGQWQKIKGKTKNDMLMFYKEIVVALENSTAVESEEDDDCDSEDDE